MIRVRSIVVGLAAVAIAAALLAAIVLTGERLPEGPEPVAWDREACAECRMHVGDPRFAVQLQTTDGHVLAFDDVGCWFAFEARERPTVHALYYRDYRRDQWIAADRARFIRVAGTPMASGVAAVEGAEPGSIALEEAMQAALRGPREASP